MSRQLTVALIWLLGSILFPGAVTSQDAASGAAKSKETPPMKVAAKERIKNNIRRLLQNSRMERAAALVEKAITDGEKHPLNKDLLAFACWARAVLEGNKSKDPGAQEDEPKKRCLEYFDRAIENGWKNPFTFQYAALIRDDIRSSPEFVARVEKLGAAFEEAEREEFSKRLEKGFFDAAQDGGIFPLPEAITGDSALAAKLEGRPAMLAVTRIYHDGFLKALPVLEELSAEYGDSVPTVILFYQAFEDDEFRRQLTARYIDTHEIKVPSVIVTRRYIEPLSIPIFPTFLFLDHEGRLVLRQEGLLHERFMSKFFRLAYEELVKREPQPEPQPKPEPQKPQPASQPEPQKPEEAAKPDSAEPAKPAEKVKEAIEKPAEKAKDAIEKPAEKVKDAAEKAAEKIRKKLPDLPTEPPVPAPEKKSGDDPIE